MIAAKNTSYYVYEHCRKNTGSVFYVGKGKGSRATKATGRSQYWQNVVAKADGFVIKFVANDVDEELAFLAEVERIDQYQRIGARLCNLTTGGEGTSGRLMSEELKSRLREVTRERMATPEAKKAHGSFMRKWWSDVDAKDRTREKIRQALNSPDVYEKLAARNRARMADPLVQEKIRQASKAQWSDPAARESMRKKGLTRMADPSARQHLRQLAKLRMSNPEERQRIRDALMAAERVVCPHCGKQGAKSPMSRWHFDNCKHKGEA